MTPKASTQKVTLQKRVIFSRDLIFEATRELALPVNPFVGLRLYNAEWRPPGFEESEDEITEIGYDVKTDRLFCYLPTDDFRKEASGSDDWTEQEVRAYYRDWTLKRDIPPKVPRQQTARRK